MTVGITELPPEGMQLGGVALAGDAERGTKTTEGLSLLFTTAGITVQGPQPQIERLLVWSGLDSASCREKLALPDGRNAAVMELTSGGQSIRFLLPLDTVTPGQAAYLDQALPAWLTRYKGIAPATQAPESASPAYANGVPAPSEGHANGDAGGADTSPLGPSASPTAPTGGQVAPAAASGVAAAATTNGAARGTADPGVDPTASPAPASFGSTPPPPGSGADAAARPDPPAPGPSFIARSSTGSLPPPPPGAAPGPAPQPPGTPPPPAQAGSAPAPPVGTAGWAVSTDPLPGAVAWDEPALSQAPSTHSKAPAKKTRGWRKARPPVVPPVPPPGALAPMQPPAEPPANPVPLSLTTPLPPPPPERSGASVTQGPVVWKPPVDPTTGEALWDQEQALPESPTKTKGWRKGAKAGAGAAGAAALADRADCNAAATGAAVAPAPGTSPFVGIPAPGAPGAPDSEVKLAGSTGNASPKSNRALVAVLLVVLIIVIGGIAYFAVKRNSNTTATTGTVATTPSPSPTVTDTALAASINLHLTDLRGGWSQSPSTAKSALPPTLAAAQLQANRGLAGCLGEPYAVVAGLFGGSALPGRTGFAQSPTFQSDADPGIQMASTTTVMSTVADSQALAVPFTNPKFVTCFAQFQTALVAAAVPGSTAQVQAVTLPVPSGVKSFAYLTTFTSPSKGTEVKGEAFILGGRVETLLEPTTNGPAVPQSAFASAYDSITGRVAQAVNK
jgi:hypothetical protein